MPTELNKIPNGAFSRAPRFARSAVATDSPGPIYSPDVKEHTPTPLLRRSVLESDDSAPGEHKASTTRSLSSTRAIADPGRDRTAWLLGSSKNEIAYYSEIADLQGPAAYQHHGDYAKLRQSAPRPVFPKDRRFGPVNFVSNDLNKHNLCRESPGPAYNPQVCSISSLLFLIDCFRFPRMNCDRIRSLASRSVIMVRLRIRRRRSPTRSESVSRRHCETENDASR